MWLEPGFVAREGRGQERACRGRLGVERESLRCQGEQLHFELRPVLFKPSEHKLRLQAHSV